MLVVVKSEIRINKRKKIGPYCPYYFANHFLA